MKIAIPFNANPEKYAPQYGGFCAYGAAFGKKFDIDGKVFEVLDGKLYVNKTLMYTKYGLKKKLKM